MSDQIEYAITPQAVFEPETVVLYAYGIDNAQALAAEKQAETGKGWRIYARVAGHVGDSFPRSCAWVRYRLHSLGVLRYGDPLA